MISFLINSIGLGVGLAMDAFSVSLANGLAEPKMRKSKMAKIAFVYGFFQLIMPMIGWVCVHTIAEQFAGFQKVIPWIALVLLLFIGGKMLYEGLTMRGHEEEEEIIAVLTKKALLVQGIATSIDALSVGFTIADYRFIKALAAAIVIGVVTFAICFVGLMIGKKVGTRLSWKANVLGGVILIAIGVKIFVRGV